MVKRRNLDAREYSKLGQGAIHVIIMSISFAFVESSFDFLSNRGIYKYYKNS